MGDDDIEERGDYLEDAFSSPASDAEETGQTPSAGKASNTPQTDDSASTPDTSTASKTPIRERPTKLLYLEDEFKDELELTFDELNLKYKREHGEKLNQNEHFYPQLLRLALDELGDVRDRDLSELEALLDLPDGEG